MWKAARMFLWMTFLTGILYPLLITAIAQLTMKHKADGSFLFSQNKRIGSELIAQKFESEKYFWPRPSFNNYDPLQSGGSNFGPTSKELKKAVEERRQKFNADKKLIPLELLFASGSGLDPHISVTTAYFQMERIARQRKKGTKEIKDLIDKMSIRPIFFGEPFVNVLLLNKALDEAFHGD
jgi:potassium-transporting ATPase KdpC subunit